MTRTGSHTPRSLDLVTGNLALKTVPCLDCGYDSWDRLAFVSHGSRIEIRVEPNGLLDQVRAVLPPGSVETDLGTVDAFYRLEKDASAPRGGRYRIIRDGDAVLRSASIGDALRGLGNALHYGVAANSPTMLFVHAGVVARGGQVILLPGASRSGKSSLVDALVRAGAAYFSDEGAPIDQDGLVHPYRKPLWLRDDHPRHRRPAHIERAQQPGSVDEALPVGLILFQQYRPEAKWAPRRLTPGHALLRLIPHAVLAATSPERTLAALSRLVVRAPAYTTSRPDADVVAHVLLQLLETIPADSTSSVIADPDARFRSLA